MKCFILTLLLSIAMIAALPCRAAEDVSELSRHSTAELVKLGQDADSDNNPERALGYFTVAAKRYFLWSCDKA